MMYGSESMATRKTEARKQLIDDISDLVRRVSTQTVLFHHAIAEKLGLGPTDHKCLDLAFRPETAPDGRLTPGRLCEATGLTSGAITGVLDRLEKAGYIRREKDPADRRQVLIRVVPEKLQPLFETFGEVNRRWNQGCERYSDEQLRFIQGFIREQLAASEEMIKALREPPTPEEKSAPGQVQSAPLDGITHARLELRSAKLLTLAGGPADLLYRARGVFGTSLLRVRHKGTAGTLTARGSLEAVTLELGTTPRWSVVATGGVDHVGLDARDLALTALEVQGGARDFKVALGQPDGELRVRLSGGAQDFSLTCPAGVPLRLTVAGGARTLSLNGAPLGDAGALQWEAPEYASARSRVAIEIRGGVERMSLSHAAGG
jgi:DNA-binding MarR family transcriptional regulator